MKNSTKIRALIADDSIFMRRAISSIFKSDDEIEIVGEARNGKEATEKVRELKPDIVTMDVEMPVMTGIEALKVIMRENPVPVIMISSLTSEGASATMEALAIGAVDFLPKKGGSHGPGFEAMREELLAKVKGVARNRLLRARMRLKKSSAPSGTPGSAPATQSNLSLRERIELRKKNKMAEQNVSASPAPVGRSQGTSSANKKLIKKAPRPKASYYDIMVIGVSTGGPIALHSVIPHLPADFPVPVLIIQHMPPHFTKSLADRLNYLSHVNVREAAHGELLKAGDVLVAPGGRHLAVGRDSRTIKILDEPADSLYKPAVDVTLRSLTRQFGGHILGVIMTGMGHDGRDGLIEASQRGAYILAQDEESCVVYGMPKAVVDAGIANEIISLEDLPETIASCLGMHAVQARKS